EVAAAFVAVGLPLAILLVAFPARVVALLGRLDPGGRSAFLRKVAGVVETFASGLRVLRRGRELFACLALSLALWLAIDLSVYLTLVAFGLPLVFSDTFLLLVPLAVGIAVPTPGGVGPYEYLGQISLTDFWGVGAASAAATAVVLHIIALVPTIVIGLLFMWRDGLRLADVRAAGAADPIRETPS
ncbi:MAG TPA: lysylphosphatidylglycerol synthase domain-containing protein, partial [Candidatus Polarisedimenticolia bacterium]|nr:lysylphosphatidylglycerol synthase domain-containing protein [Candidatus Polarisedimenticolia bacterium]